MNYSQDSWKQELEERIERQKCVAGMQFLAMQQLIKASKY
jgi:hypothetical protein